MLSKVAFISDFFYPSVSGGAEIYDSVLIDEIQNRGVKVCKFTSGEFTSNHLKLYKESGFKFLISNFVGLQDEVKSALSFTDCEYFILEHDHKYVANRNPASFKDFMAPEHMITNRDFYSNAQQIFCQSEKHRSVLSKNLGLSNVVNLSCSLWSKEQTDIIRKHISETKNKKCFILGDPNPIKGLDMAVRHCKQNGLDYDVLPKTTYEEYIKSMSEYEKLVFFPSTLESFCRLVVEARMLNCGIATNNLNGCTSEEWFSKLKGLELIDFVDSQRTDVVNLILEHLQNEKKQANQGGDITVILNSYRRPYNLKKQIEALRSQTIKPKQIWLWVNEHDDNKGFDYSDLGVDRIFHNDHNWKFYGRFAAALLADTEYVAVYDDDTIPGQRWHENCLDTMKSREGILGSAGVVLNGSKYVQHERCGWATQNAEIVEVDLVGHAWFFKREWLRYLWQEKPVTWDNGEDIHFSSMAKIHGGISTYCPPHPPGLKDMHGSILGNELGIDSKATSNNTSVSHKQFFGERDRCVQSALIKGWNTVRGVKI